MLSFWQPFILSIELALLTTLSLALFGFGLAFVITNYNFRLKSVLKSIVTLPLVLPPSVLGYYLLISFQPEAIIGSVFDTFFDMNLAFSFEGILFGSIIFSLPFMVNPVVAAIENLPSSLKEASFTLGKSRFTTYTKVLLPNIKPAILTSLIMTFAHTIGEFGVILMIGGNIPGETRVASLAIYHELEALNYDVADSYSMILLIFSISVLLLVYFFQRKFKADFT